MPALYSTDGERRKWTPQFTAIIEREEEGYVALCPELDIFVKNVEQYV